MSNGLQPCDQYLTMTNTPDKETTQQIPGGINLYFSAEEISLFQFS